MELTQIIDPLLNPILHEETMRINKLIKGKGAAIDEDLKFTKFIFTLELSFLKKLTEVNKDCHKKVQPLLEKAKAYAVPANVAFYCFTILETAEEFDKYKVIWMQNMLYEDAFSKPTKTDSNVSPDKTIKTVKYQSPYYPEDKTNQLQEWEYRNHLLKQIAPNLNLLDTEFKIQGKIYNKYGTNNEKEEYSAIQSLLYNKIILQKLLYIKKIVSVDKPESISHIEKILHESLKTDYPNGFLLLVGLAIQRQYKRALTFENTTTNIAEYSGIAGVIPWIRQYFYHLFIEKHYDFFLSFFETFLEKHINKRFYVHPSFVNRTLLGSQKSLDPDIDKGLFCPYFDQLKSCEANGLYTRILTQSNFTFKTDEKLEGNEKEAIEKDHRCPFTNGWESYQAGPFCCHTTPFLSCYFEQKNNSSYNDSLQFQDSNPVPTRQENNSSSEECERENIVVDSSSLEPENGKQSQDDTVVDNSPSLTKEAEKKPSDESKEKNKLAYNNSLQSEDENPVPTRQENNSSSEKCERENIVADNSSLEPENGNQPITRQDEDSSSKKGNEPIFVYLWLILKQFFQLVLKTIRFHFYK